MTASSSAIDAKVMSSALATLKIAVFAPIARASERIAVAVKPRVDANVRTAYQRSWRREFMCKDFSVDEGDGVNGFHNGETEGSGRPLRNSLR